MYYSIACTININFYSKYNNQQGNYSFMFYAVLVFLFEVHV